MNKTRINKTRLIAATGALAATLGGVGLAAAPAQALVNQTDAAVGAYPFYADLSGYCGGTLIDSEWVLTAAHCPGWTGLQVNIGYVSDAAPGVATVVRDRIASDFTDIALLRVDPVVGIKPISIALDPLVKGDTVTSVASGSGSNGKLGSADFRVTDQPGPLNSTPGSPNFTMRGIDPATASCGGDSGSPVISTAGAVPRLVGTTFAISGHCEGGDSTFAASIQTDRVMNWITSAIGRPLGEYVIWNKNSGRVLDVNAAGEIVQKTRTDAATQKWRFTPDVGTTPRPAAHPVNIRNSGTRQLLGVVGGAGNDGAVAVQFPDVDAPDQSWSFGTPQNGYMTIVNSNSGKVLGIPGGSKTEGEKAVQWTGLGVDDQQWQLIRVG